ncbi:hypothetical protein L226DRAFT_534222 [Lentinus tigrinus ALCF2SS1-7]|uniref:WW domain-containing protein n=1 Tax=Lentinus tigrinus ALCF2SS1-6 TaxID=1328759 RepID=A0A5C2SEE6_9APHY|nr:hypothetical protein L227DRAFT_574074 [Lentinus tigrinus ALCF2SS1-6]RPD76172.1 hypothetical protein L226DRAFT_534222 [Lentinus tigrinus ALCF2SS1-7]
MSSPAPDTASPATLNEQSPRRDDGDFKQGTSEVEHDNSEAPRDASPSCSAPTPALNSTVAPSASSSSSDTAPANAWQAVWSPAHNAYYFYNSVTQETTWTNPLQLNAEAGPSNSTPPSADATDTPAASSSSHDIYTAAAAQGIDPALAHLDPSLAASGSAPSAFTYTAKFNARTGAFTRPDGRDPTHLSEYERAKRMSEFYFDVNAWEHDVEKRKLEEAQEEEEGRKRKKPSKKDLERFREQKRQKKLAKTAWLRT